MKRHTLIAGITTLFLVGAVFTGCGQSNSNATATGSTNAAAPSTDSLATAVSQSAGIIYQARQGSKMRIEGTANIIHPTWQIESPIIGGMMEVGPNFPIEPGQAATPGKMDAKANVFIMVRSLKSMKEDGTQYSDRMDEVMCEHLKETQFRQILYHLTELTLKEGPKTNGGPYVFESKGNLTIAGVTNNITMVVYILPTVAKGEKRLEVTGSTAVKMTDFKVAPVDINLVLGHITTGDQVKLIFKWVLGQKKAVPAASTP
jgi:polyisoprenoid-binding protein YceI